MFFQIIFFKEGSEANGEVRSELSFCHLLLSFSPVSPGPLTPRAKRSAKRNLQDSRKHVVGKRPCAAGNYFWAPKFVLSCQHLSGSVPFYSSLLFSSGHTAPVPAGGEGSYHLPKHTPQQWPQWDSPLRLNYLCQISFLLHRP